MNRIKDFFYNKNDIIIVLIILVAATFIIYTRIDAIMAYPEQLAEQAAQQETTEDTSDTSQSSDSSSSSDTTSSVSITITDSDTSDTVAAKLYEAGLIASDTEFTEYVSSQGKEGSLKSGTFQINMDSSNEDILNIIAN